MIDSTILDVRHQDECRPKSKSELEDFQIYGDNNDWVDHTRANLDPSGKVQLKHLMEQYRKIFV